MGWFPASLIVPSLTAGKAEPNPASCSAYISTPLKGSLHHTGHGDINPERCWGTPENQTELVGLLIYFMTCSIL